MSIASVIHFCTNDCRFLRRNIEAAKQVSDSVVVVVCDHFFNGEPEDRKKLNWAYQEFPECQFIEFEYDQEKLYTPFQSLYTPQDRGWSHSWHATSRLIGALFSPPSCEYLLFLDSDEIAEVDPLKQWIETKEYLSFHALRLGAFSFFPNGRRTEQVYASALFVKRSALDVLSMVQCQDRWGIFQQIGEPKQECSYPFFHHYCWVRPKEECLQKSKTWGHRLDCDWTGKIDRLFEQEVDPTPMGYALELCDGEANFDPFSVELIFKTSKEPPFSNVRRVSRKETVAYMLEASFETH